MRLFDKCLSVPCGELGRQMRNRHPQAVLCADVIASHFYMSPKEDWLPGDYPFCKPPWKSCFVEWNNPPLMNLSGSLHALCDDAQQVGIFCQVSSNLNFTDRRYMTKAMAAFEYSHASPDDAETAVYGMLAACLGGAVIAPQFVWSCWLDREGNYLAGASIGPDASYGFTMSNYQTIMLLAFTFANCCNVKLEDATEELQPIPKIRRRLKIPEVKRYTLNIAGHISRPSREYTKGPQGVMPFHLCRGHFATYTADRPMFGNPKLIGRYWHPPHIKGKKENGEIIKDYAITAD